MPEVIRQLTDEGIAAFGEWLRAGALGPVPGDLIADQRYALSLGEVVLPPDKIFTDRYEFGLYLAEALRSFDSRSISFDNGLWSWLAAYFFEQLCPRNSDGSRSLRKDYVYIPIQPRIYYRHLVRTPWYLVHTHGEACKYLLINPRSDDPAPLSRQAYLLDQLAARQFVIASPTLIAAARLLYTNPKTGLPKRGAGAKGEGSPRRLALIANQLSLTFDIRDMPVDSFMKLLPQEFRYLW